MEETIIKRTEMNIYYLFFEKETYELIMQTYSKNAIAMFNEEASIENVNAKFLQENMLNNYIKKKLVELDKNKPIEKNGEYLLTFMSLSLDVEVEVRHIYGKLLQENFQMIELAILIKKLLKTSI